MWNKEKQKAETECADQDRALLAESLEHFDSTRAGNHDVENDQIQDARAGVEESLLTGLRQSHRVAFDFEALFQPGPNSGFVFHYQDLHYSASLLYTGRSWWSAT